jgi:hydroxyacylglutathione hydrolase
MKIIQIPLLRDNYGYLVICLKTNKAVIIDPSEAEPVLRRVEQEKVALVAIANTHHHRDHTGGNEGLLAHLEHVAYLFGNSLFCGDTLFTAGCGRLFEGTPEQMQASLKKLMALPDDTKVYCGHEYTENNLRFAMTLEPKNHKLASRLDRVQSLRARGVSTVPSTMEEEKQTNPFLRWDSKEIQTNLKAGAKDLRLDPVSIFARVRKLKDAF